MRGGKRGSPKRFASVTCHVCGREYGTRSFGIHLKQCESLWVARESQKPRAQRRKVPSAPSTLGAVLQGGASGGLTNELMERHRDESFKTYNNEALVACENCGRTFLPEKLAAHQRGCSAERPMKSVQRAVTEQQSARKRAQRQRGADIEASAATPSPSRASPSSRPSPARGSGAAATRRGGALAQPRTPPAARRPEADSSALSPSAAPAGYLGAGAIPLIEAHVEQLERTLGDHARTMRTMQTQLLELKNTLAVLRERAASSSLPPASPTP